MAESMLAQISEQDLHLINIGGLIMRDGIQMRLHFAEQ